MEQQGRGSLGFLMMPVFEGNNHPQFLIYVPSKSEVMQNSFNLQEWHQKHPELYNLYSDKHLFTIRH